MGLLECGLSGEHGADTLVMVEEAGGGFFEASDFFEKVSHIQLLAYFLPGFIDFSHFGPAFRGYAEDIKPVVNCIANVSEEAKVVFFDFSAGLIESKSSLSSIEFVAILVKGAQEESDCNPQQPEQTTHI